MAWQDRIQDAAYVSPSGVRIELLYENVSKKKVARTTAYEFPDAPGTFVQDLGRSGRRIPLRIFFSGDNYDLEAAVFDAALDEIGVATLEHPIYGSIKVVPFGDLNRRDDLKTAGNQAVFDIVFFETNELLFMVDDQNPISQIQRALLAFAEAAPVQFEQTLDLSTTIEAVAERDRFKELVGQVRSGLQDVANASAIVGRTFDLIFESINIAIDTFVADPLALAFQLGILMQLPARASAAILDRLDAYTNLLFLIIDAGNVQLPGIDSQPDNNFRNDDLFAANLVMGSITSVIDSTFELRSEALDAAERISELCDSWNTWRDLNLESLSIIDTGEMYQQVQRACSATEGFLVQISFTLKQERSITLDRPRTPIDLEGELYGTAGENLDFLIVSNGIVGLNIFEVPTGTRVVYYT